eukprot:scaffold418_cov386-Prasinococcus_capsulatus_cf.AAC.10
MLVWRPRPSGTSSPRLLARGYPGAAHGPHRPVTAPRRRRSAWLSAEREIRARVVDTSDVARMEQVVADVEAATVARYTKGSHHCAWAPDKYSKAGCNDHKVSLRQPRHLHRHSSPASCAHLAVLAR